MPFTNTEANAAEQAFIARMAESLPDTDAPTDAPAAAAPAVVPEDSPAPPASTTETADDDDAASDAPPDAVDATDAPADAPESDDADADEDTSEEPDAPAPAEPPVSPAFAAALAKEGAKLSLDDVPAEARPFVQQRVKELEAGFTKARQRDTAQLVELRAEQRFQSERPADFIVSLIRSDPKIADAVNAKLDELDGSTIAAEAHDVVVKHARDAAKSAETTAVADAEAADREVAALDAHLDAALAARGVKPGKALERLIVAACDVAEAKTGTRRITRADVDAIVADYASDVTAEREHARRLQKRTDRRTYVQGKVADRATAGLVVKPGAGTPPAPAPEARPKNDEEFTHRFAARL